MNNDLISSIEAMCNEPGQTSAEILAKIRIAIRNSKKPDFSKIMDGEHFVYRGIEFIRLGLEQGGVLCMTAEPWRIQQFDLWNNNCLRDSSTMKKMKDQFLPLLNRDDIRVFITDLTADNGDTSYGAMSSFVSILTCDQVRKYHEIIPSFRDQIWTATPVMCDNRPCSKGPVRTLRPDGTLGWETTCWLYGVAPVCVFCL